MRTLAVLIALLLLATSNIAAASEGSDLAKELMQAVRFDAMLESVQKDTQKMVQTQMEGIVNQIQKSNPKIPEAVLKEFKTAADNFGRRICESWSSSEAAKIYSSELVKGLPETEMRSAIGHYSSPQGQRELKVINDAMNKTNSYIMGSIQKETDSAMKDFLGEVDQIIERARNRAAAGEAR